MRVAKGKMKVASPGELPITQQNKFNLKVSDWKLLREAIEHCESCSDYVSRDLFNAILESEEEHVDWLETQLDLIERVGLENYQQSQIG